MTTVGERLKRLINQSGYRQHEVSDALGIARATVTQWVTNRNSPKRYIMELSELLNTTPEFILYGEEGKKPKQRVKVELPSERPHFQITKRTQTDHHAPLIDKDEIASFLKTGKHQQDSAEILSTFPVSDQAFYYREDLSGMSPFIEPGSRVLVDPQLPLHVGRWPAMFCVEGEYVVASTKRVPGGLLLEFTETGAGWEPIKTDSSGYVGMVVSVIPDWQQSLLNDE